MAHSIPLACFHVRITCIIIFESESFKPSILKKKTQNETALYFYFLLLIISIQMMLCRFNAQFFMALKHTIHSVIDMRHSNYNVNYIGSGGFFNL